MANEHSEDTRQSETAVTIVTAIPDLMTVLRFKDEQKKLPAKFDGFHNSPPAVGISVLLETGKGLQLLRHESGEYSLTGLVNHREGAFSIPIGEVIDVKKIQPDRKRFDEVVECVSTALLTALILAEGAKDDETYGRPEQPIDTGYKLGENTVLRLCASSAEGEGQWGCGFILDAENGAGFTRLIYGSDIAGTPFRIDTISYCDRWRLHAADVALVALSETLTPILVR